MNEFLPPDLVSADPVAGDEDVRLRDLVRRMAIDVRVEATAVSPSSAAWWKRRRTMIPLGIAGVVALTGAALVVPLNLAVNGTPVEPDVVIPIVYTTDTGVDVSCRYALYFGDPAHRSEADKQLAAIVKHHDWTGIGQDIYRRAIADPFAPGPEGGMEVDTPEGRDELSLVRATSRAIEDELPADLQSADASGSGLLSRAITDCKGQLH